MFTFLEDCPEDIRGDMIYMEACELSMERAVLAADVAGKLEALNARASELRLAATGDDFDAMVAYYEEAGENPESSEKKKGIIKRAWDAILNFFKNLKAKFFGSDPGKNIDDNATAEVPAGIKGVMDKLSAFVAKLRQCASDHSGALIAGTVAAGVAAIGAFAFMHSETGKNVKTIRMQGKEAKKMIKDAEKAGDELHTLVPKLLQANITVSGETAKALDENDMKAAMKAVKGDLMQQLGSVLKSGFTVEAGVNYIRGKISEVGTTIKSFVTWLVGKFKKGGNAGDVVEESGEAGDPFEESWDEIDALLNLVSGGI